MANIGWRWKAELSNAVKYFYLGCTGWEQLKCFRRFLIAGSSERLEPSSSSFKFSFVHGFQGRKRLFIFRSHIYVEFITADIAALRLKIPACYQGAAALTCYSGDFIVRLKYSSGKGESGNWFISNRNQVSVHMLSVPLVAALPRTNVHHCWQQVCLRRIGNMHNPFFPLLSCSLLPWFWLCPCIL